MNTKLPMLVLALSLGFDAKPIKIDLAHQTSQELKTKALLEQVIGAYDLTRFTFKRRVVIEERAMNHAFPVLTLNARFADSADELLSSYIHEQLHWYLRDRNREMRDAVADLTRLLGPERTSAVISDKGYYTWIYLTILRDEPKIASVVDRYRLRIR